MTEDDEYGVSPEKGFNRKDFDEIVDDIESRLVNLMGNDIDLGKTSPLKHIIDSVSFEIARNWDMAQHIYSSGYIDEASGTNLEKIAKLAGVIRNPATSSYGKVTFEGEEGVEIDEGFTVATEDDLTFDTYTNEDEGYVGSGTFSSTYETEEDAGEGETWGDGDSLSVFFDSSDDYSSLDVELDDGTSVSHTVDTGTITINENTGERYIYVIYHFDGVSSKITLDVKSNERGSHTNVAEDRITKLVDEKSGVYDVYSSTDTNGGEDVESDKELRMRTKTVLEERGNATKTAIRRRILNVDGVTGVYIDEDTNIVKMYITVDGLGQFEGTSDEDTLIDAMESVRAYGIPYELNSPTLVNIQVGGSGDEVSVTTEEEYPDDATTQIENNIKDYIDDLSIGEDVLYAKLYDVIYNTGDWVYNVDNLQLAKKGNTLGTGDIAIEGDLKEKSTISTDDIYLSFSVKS